MSRKAKLNGIVYECTKDGHALRQVLVSFPSVGEITAVRDEEMTTLMIPSDKAVIMSQTDAQAFIDALANVKDAEGNPLEAYITVTSSVDEVLNECAKRNNRLYDFYSIYFSGSLMHHTPRMQNFFVVDKESTNSTIFRADMISAYRKYAISSVEVMDAFLKKLATGLGKRDIALMIKDVNYAYPNKKDVVFYSFTKVDDQVCPNSAVPVFSTDTGVCIYEMQVQFSASFANFINYERFRKDYQQYIFCSDILSFDTHGKAIVGWEDPETPILKDYTMSNSVFWEPIDKSFSHQFQTNDKGANAFPLEFSCRIRYNVVSGVSEQMATINDIICYLVEANTRGEIVNQEEIKISK